MKHIVKDKKWNEKKVDPFKYPPNEDIYKRGIETDIDPEALIEQDRSISKNTKDIDENNLDVPGAELDDSREHTGNEDEENNYYSLGGDNHD